MKALLYCTKGKPYLVKKEINYIDTKRKEVKYLIGNKYAYDNWINGEIVAECDYEVEEIKLNEYDDYNFSHYSFMYFETETLQEEELCKQSCLTADELDEYLDLYKYKKVYGYAIHIKNLHVFDKPRKLKEFKQKGEYQCSKSKCPYFDTEKCHYAGECLYEKIITKAPQNMMYVFDGDEKKVLISIHPEHLCKILNGEKTIEVRKTILKYM